MEAGYVDHQKSVISASDKVDSNEALSISMTVTRDASGNLLIGNCFSVQLFFALPLHVEYSFFSSYNLHNHVSCSYIYSICCPTTSGSSRQFAGFNTELDTFIVDRIWERAQDFFPSLKEFSVKNLSEQMNVRIGLRPYSKSCQ